jgi:hypothetical protein
VQEAAVSPLRAWASFYLITGTSAGTLTGLMFVVITLIAGVRTRSSDEQVKAFGTPTVVHFCLALLVSAILCAPWEAFWHVALALGLTGLGGTGYVVIVVRRTRRQDEYQPVLEDWLGHVIFPLVAYAALVVAAILLPGNPAPTLFGVGAATLVLLFTSIHNAWDTVTYVTLNFLQPQDEGKDLEQPGNTDA